MKLLTIGQLAKRAGVRTSTLRYYEEQGLLAPKKRTESGYRLYDDDAEQTLTFIQRAQRLGFSLADIQTFLNDLKDGDLRDETVVDRAETRFLAIERQLTELLVVRHELELFLLDFMNRMEHQSENPAHTLYEQFVTRVCSDPSLEAAGAESTLDWLLERTGCALAGLDRQSLVQALAGKHTHIWREGDGYTIFVAEDTAEIKIALEELARIEADCHIHADPQLSRADDGYRFHVQGENAFVFAQFFLSLERKSEG